MCLPALSDAGLVNDQLRGYRRGGPRLVRSSGHLQEQAGQAEPVQEPVAQEQDGRRGGTVPGEDGGLQGHLEDMQTHVSRRDCTCPAEKEASWDQA